MAEHQLHVKKDGMTMKALGPTLLLLGSVLLGLCATVTVGVLFGLHMRVQERDEWKAQATRCAVQLDGMHAMLIGVLQQEKPRAGVDGG